MIGFRRKYFSIQNHSNPLKQFSFSEKQAGSLNILQKYLIAVDIFSFLYYVAPAKIKYSPVAQSVERLAVNQHVRGSSPRWGARIKKPNYKKLGFLV